MIEWPNTQTKIVTEFVQKSLLLNPYFLGKAKELIDKRTKYDAIYLMGCIVEKTFLEPLDLDSNDDGLYGELLIDALSRVRWYDIGRMYIKEVRKVE